MKKREPKVGIGVILFNQEGKILLGKRKGSHGTGKYSFPGGHLEYSENLDQCAKRETLEETGLGIYLFSKNPVALTNDFFKKEEKHYITLFMKSKRLGDQEPRVLEPEKCEFWKWYDWENFPDESELFLPILNLRKQGYDPRKI